MARVISVVVFVFIFQNIGILLNGVNAEEEWHDKGVLWPKDSSAPCSQTTKQKAMYGSMTVVPSLRGKPTKKISVNVRWDALEFAPHNSRKQGGVYVAYTTGVKDGPGGYFGVQISAKQGQFIFSIWDEDRWSGSGENKKPKASKKLTWPLYMRNCRRNCQDCGMQHLKPWQQKGLTTGTKCIMSYPKMKVGDEYKVTLRQLLSQRTIYTRNYGGMPVSHSQFGEMDRLVTGGVWEMSVQDLKTKNNMVIGQILFEGDGRGMNRLGTFDEMIGCNKCNAIYHKDTRYNLKIYGNDNSLRRITGMQGKTRAYESTCKDYMITGSKDNLSITLEGGPLTTGDFPEDRQNHGIWKK